MNRKEELLNAIKERKELVPLVDEVIFLEDHLAKLKKMPFIKTHPANEELQKVTPASRQYKELLQQYTNCIKILSRACGEQDQGEESPLRKWVKKHVDTKQNNMETG